MYDAEAEMAKALEGKFFWAPGIESRAPSEELAIRKAQRKFRNVRKEPGEQVLDGEVPPWVIQRLTNDDAGKIEYLKYAISVTYGVTVKDLMRQINDPKICRAKHHFHCALMRCFPEASLSEISRKVGKNHATLINSRKKFKALEAESQKLIARIDEMMENFRCG